MTKQDNLVPAAQPAKGAIPDDLKDAHRKAKSGDYFIAERISSRGHTDTEGVDEEDCPALETIIERIGRDEEALRKVVGLGEPYMHSHEGGDNFKKRLAAWKACRAALAASSGTPKEKI